MATPRLKNDGDQITARNGADSADVSLKALDIILSGGTIAAGRVLTSDTVGRGSWQVNPAIQAAADAQTAANNAQTTANAANSAAAAADAVAVAAGAAAAAAGVTATSALGLAGTALIDAGNANTLAGSAQTTANNAQALAADAYPINLAIEPDELIWTVGAPIYNNNQPTFVRSYIVFTATNLAECYIDVILRGGVWNFTMNALTRNDAGRVSISVGSSVIADPQELYTLAANHIARFSYNNVDVSNGINRILFKVNGKNASSSSYVFLMNKFYGYRVS